jgi:pantetheine-phosphate adenylyltransferase
MSQRVAIYPGSFDPPTNGHLDIVERSARLFDRVVVGVGRNLAKKTLFDAERRVALMKEACARWPNVEVRSFDMLQVEFAKQCGASFIVRGIRALSDFEFEFEMANMNRSIASGIEMVYLMTAPEYLFISASRVKELAAFGAPIEKYVPANVAKALRAHSGQGSLRTGATEAND